jgi:hypothetical protein
MGMVEPSTASSCATRLISTAVVPFTWLHHLQHFIPFVNHSIGLGGWLLLTCGFWKNAAGDVV